MKIDATGATQILDQYFAAFDTARQDDASQADGKISVEDLRTVEANLDGRFSDQEIEAARFLLDSAAARSFLDVGAGRGDVDGTISREDIDGALTTIASGGLEHALLDTAAGNGGADDYIGGIDLDAAQTDAGIPQSLKDALRQLPPDLPLQTQLRTVFALRNLAGDGIAAAQLSLVAGSDAFKGLDEAQQAQALALFGGTNAVSKSARSDLDLAGLGLSDLDLTDPESLQRYLLTGATPADRWRDAAPASGTPDELRKDYAVTGPESIDYEFPSGTVPDAVEVLPAWRYTVEVDGQSIEVIVPQADGLDTGTYSYPSVDQIAKGLAAQPSTSLEATERVVVNPVTPLERDSETGVVSESGAPMYATGGTTIGINPNAADDPRDQANLDFTFLHETAHLVEQPSKGFGIFSEWNQAVLKDRLFSTHYADDRYVPKGGSSVEPSMGADPGEDFAEAYMIYHLVKGTPDEVQMRALMPERFAILDRMFP